MINFQETITSIGSAQKSGKFDKSPDICPICHHAIQPKKHTLVAKNDFSEATIVFQCTRVQCQGLFLAYYRASDARPHTVIYSYKSSKPISPQRATFPECIGEISEGFIKIYNQALAAEAGGLDEIAGIGLRKALEFLTKDFLISQHPEKKEEIKKAFLGKCIDNYVEDPNIKICAQLATWLGNDQAHYVKKWEDKDIVDLKNLIKLTVNWIESDHLTKHYRKDMAPDQIEETAD